MIKKDYWRFMVSKAVWILFFSQLPVFAANANPCADTTQKPLLAEVDNACYLTIAPNVEFPEVLCGNEESTLEYIENFSVNRRAYLIRTYNRSKKYFPKATAILTKYNLPHELKVLLALESAFNANAVSKAGAVGYWQIMDEVAREYGLKYIPKQKTAAVKKKHSKKAAPVRKTPVGRDDRKNFSKSTYMAARYLKDRSRNLDNNLLLMVASYNCGVGNVWDAMKKCGKENPDFWDIKDYLPAETRTYVMNFITLNVIFHNYEKFTNNTLIFTPSKIKASELEGNNAADLSSSAIEN